MIDRRELEAKSEEFEIHIANVERDYVFGWLIHGIFTITNLKEVIFLKGGNALRKGYFENTRFSSDLDFGIPGDIDQSTLVSELNRVCDFIEQRTDVAFRKDDNRVEEKFLADGQPGIRCFVPANVESIENTHEKFEPRFPIELSKAGEMPENRYLFDPNRPARAPRIGRSGILRTKRRAGPKYIYQCFNCGKKFSKTTRNNSLREHKDKNGYRCSGKRGYYVGAQY